MPVAAEEAPVTAPDLPAGNRPGFPVLGIRAATSVAPPVTLTTARGDEDGPGADAVRYGVMDVRLEVFVEEQGVPFSMEVDARDEEATTLHVLATGADGVPLGAARLLLEPGHPGQVHLGRLAVRRVARGTGLGARLVAAVEAAALDLAAEPLPDSAAAAVGVPPGTPGVTVALSSQEQAMGFYQRCGYRAVSRRRYLDAGIPHQDMARTVTA